MRRKHTATDKATCGRCHDPIDCRGFCECDCNRDPVTELAAKFPSPVCDDSDGSMWREEADILRRLYDSDVAGEKSPLVESRSYCQENETYAVSWHWEDYPKYPTQWDGPVVRLWSRLMIRPVRVAGGYTWIVLSDAAREELRKIVGNGERSGA